MYVHTKVALFILSLPPPPLPPPPTSPLKKKKKKKIFKCPLICGATGCNKLHHSILSSIFNLEYNHSINRAAFVCLSVCLSVCSPTPPRSFDGSSPNLVGVCRWTSELPLTGQRVDGSTGQTSLSRSRRHQAETTPLQKARRLWPVQQKAHGV